MLQHFDRRGRAVVRRDAQASGRAQSALRGHRRRRGQRRRARRGRASSGPISLWSTSSSPTAIPASRSPSKLARSRRALPVHHRQGARFPDAGPRARLPGQAVQRGRSRPRAQGRRGHIARPRARSARAGPDNLRLYAEEAARPPRRRHRPAADPRPLHRPPRPEGPRRPRLARKLSARLSFG